MARLLTAAALVVALLIVAACAPAEQTPAPGETPIAPPPTPTVETPTPALDTPEAETATPAADTPTPEADTSTPEADTATPEAETPTPEADDDDPDPDLVQAGQQLAQQLGCFSCHTTDGSASVGPTWLGLHGSTVTLQDGSTEEVDEDYIRTAIVDPTAMVRQGFTPGVMPSFENQVDDEGLDALVAYIGSLSE